MIDPYTVPTDEYRTRSTAELLDFSIRFALDRRDAQTTAAREACDRRLAVIKAILRERQQEQAADA